MQSEENHTRSEDLAPEERDERSKEKVTETLLVLISPWVESL